MLDAATAEQDTAEAHRFLVVDDSRAIQAIIRRAVERCRYPRLDLRVAADGEAALQMVQQFKPHLVITDWHMPRVTGLELLQTMRQIGWSHVRVGMVTTETSPAMLQAARQHGAVFVLNKPFDDEELVRQLCAVLPPHAPPPAPQAPQAPKVAQGPQAVQATQAAHEGRPANGPSLLSAAQCQPLLRTLMNGVPFTVTDQPALTADCLTPQTLIGLYAGAARPLSAIAVLDTHAVCILGGGAARLSPKLVRPAMQTGQPSVDMVRHATRFISEAGRLLRLAGEPGALPLSRASMAPRTFPRLTHLLAHNSGRADLQISVPGYGDGRLSFLAV